MNTNWFILCYFPVLTYVSVFYQFESWVCLLMPQQTCVSCQKPIQLGQYTGHILATCIAHSNVDQSHQ